MEWGSGRWLKRVKCLSCQPDDLNSIPQTQDKRRERTQSYMLSSGLAMHAVVCMLFPPECDVREGCSLPWSLPNPEGDEPPSTVRKALLQRHCLSVAECFLGTPVRSWVQSPPLLNNKQTNVISHIRNKQKIWNVWGYITTTLGTF